MRLIRLLFLVVIFCSCDSGSPKYVKVDKRFCIDSCLKNTFSKSFHSRGDSWGTSSSSMNGLSQKKIFDRVISYCQDFYNGYECCDYFKSSDSARKMMTDPHGYSFQICGEVK